MSKPPQPRTVKTVYYRPHEKWVITRSTDANRAVATCVGHMQVNHYGARTAEVYDDETGELHATVKRSVQGDLSIYYARDPLKFERRIDVVGSIAKGYLLGV